MRFAFVTRHLNRSGYQCLLELINEGFVPQAVIVSDRVPRLVSPYWRALSLIIYKIKCWYYRCPPLRTLDSEQKLALQNGINVLSINSLKSPDAYKAIYALNLDLLVVAGGWHEKIPISVLQIPSKGSINVHPSLLPEFRGTSVTRWQVLNGVKITGATIHQMDGEFDSGAILDNIITKAPPNITPQLLFKILAEKSAYLLVRVLRDIANNNSTELNPHEGINEFKQYYKRWIWDHTTLHIDISASLLSIGRLILSATQESYEYPGPALCLDGREFIVRQVEFVSRFYADSELSGKGYVCSLEGQFLRWEKNGDQNALLIKCIQPYGFFYLRRADVPQKWFKHHKKISIDPQSTHCEKS